MGFIEILLKYRKIAFSERDKGDKFERLMQAYLKTDPKYADIFDEVWLWNEFPGRRDFGKGDMGIDLVAKTDEGEYWAIQCKCYEEGTYIGKPQVDSFLATSSKEFEDEEGKKHQFAHRLWISTTNNWGSNANEAIKNQIPPVTRLNLIELIQAPVDWQKLEEGIHGEKSRTPRKELRPHQKEALEKVHEYFKEHDRGKLIMACGTGKTFNTLRIAEHETDGKGTILFLVPSIALLGQALREWYADAKEGINAVCICSDPKVSKQRKSIDEDTFSTVDLALPASTDTKEILRQFRRIKEKGKPGMTVVFSTYQSIDVIAEAQKKLIKSGFGEFDMIVCDEAHRTTGVTLKGEDESAFVKVHDNNFIKAKKRLYMTATPRIYGDDAISKAAQHEAILCSMDDTKLYGDEIHRIGFGEAVERNLLSDYKVIILTLKEEDVKKDLKGKITKENKEIETDDAIKLLGSINALSKHFLGDDGRTKEIDPNPMKMAVAFCQTIAISKQIKEIYNTATEEYIEELPEKDKKEMVSVSAQHMDGTMSAPVRDEMLGWLKTPGKENECRIITNVRVLSEGVDVPSLDAVLFLSARNSQIDVVQSVGRVMRKAPCKKYGYIIIPVVVPSNVEGKEALDDNKRFKVVWTVLNALRAHDDRFNALVNKIELNKKRTDGVIVGGVMPSTEHEGDSKGKKDKISEEKKRARQMILQFEDLQNAVYAKLVLKVGSRLYWEMWAKDIADIAEKQIKRISRILEENEDKRKKFAEFLTDLRSIINPSIDEGDAVEMLAQHIITKPVFEALFEGYSFVKSNAVSVSMQKMLDALHEEDVVEETKTLEKFYASVRNRAKGIDNAEGKQKVMIELYDNFFKNAFPRMVEKLGIVYTPVEVVDFIIHSVDDVLKKEFGCSLTDDNIHILDPFTGTGTFISRLLQSGLISKHDLPRKYKNEIHANEIVLLAYYIAAVNIENVYHDLTGENTEYKPFDGIVLTDTFQLGETDDRKKLFSELFPQNTERVQRQKKAPIRVIIGNPPYSIGQKSANDNAQNQPYPKLEKRIEETYVAKSEAGLNRATYDAYIKAFRWSTDRIDPKNGGIVCYVSNGQWLVANSADGFRKVIEKEFSSIWVFNLRGNARTQGELRRKEAGNVFGGGTRTPVSITLLVKNPKSKNIKAEIHYHDIGDYWNREEKLAIIEKFHSVSNNKMEWKTLKPDEHGDWINKRHDVFDDFIPLEPEKKFNLDNKSFFNTYAIGVATNRDPWVYNFSEEKIESNMKRFIDFYNVQLKAYQEAKKKNPKLKVIDFVDSDPSKIKWTVNLRKYVESENIYKFTQDEIIESVYRPFTKQVLYYHRPFIERPGLNPRLFPTPSHKNLVICVSGHGGSKKPTTIISENIVDLNCMEAGSQAFPLYYYEEAGGDKEPLLKCVEETRYVRRDGVSDFILKRASNQYGAKNIGKEDIFYYVYGILHSPEYRKAFANDLKKSLPRIPLVEDVRDFWKFRKAGRELAELHINYESAEPYKGVKVTGAEKGDFKVKKMRFPKKGGVVRGKKKKVDDKSKIFYNDNITISDVPEKAYEYVVNGKSAIEWIMERYAITIDSKSGIKNDPNDWSKEVGNPRYILDLLLSIINVSVQSVDIVNSLPKLEFE